MAHSLSLVGSMTGVRPAPEAFVHFPSMKLQSNLVIRASRIDHSGRIWRLPTRREWRRDKSKQMPRARHRRDASFDQNRSAPASARFQQSEKSMRLIGALVWNIEGRGEMIVFGIL